MDQDGAPVPTLSSERRPPHPGPLPRGRGRILAPRMRRERVGVRVGAREGSGHDRDLASGDGRAGGGRGAGRDHRGSAAGADRRRLKRAFGRPSEADARLDTSALAGIVLYEPEELVLTAKPVTPLAEIKSVLAERRQMLAFEPGDLDLLAGRWRRVRLERSRHARRRDRLQPGGAASHQGRRGARPHAGVSRRERARRAVQGGRARRQERDRLRSVEAHNRVVRHARRNH